MKTFAIYAAGLLLFGWASGAVAAPICDGIYDNEPATMKLGRVVRHGRLKSRANTPGEGRADPKR